MIRKKCSINPLNLHKIFQVTAMELVHINGGFYGNI